MVNAIYIPEILRILQNIRIYSQEKTVNTETLERTLSKNLVEGRFFIMTHLDMLCDFNLVNNEQHCYSLTEVGNYLLNVNPNDDIYPTDDQLEILRHCIFNCFGTTEKSVSDLVSRFSYNRSNESLALSVSMLSRHTFEFVITQLFIKTGIIRIKNNYYEINETYIENIQRLIREKKGLSPEYLEIILKKMKDIGNYAEQLCIGYETSRLNRLNKLIQAKMIKQVSVNDASAGYDIASYNGTSILLTHDRFIEVKATSSSKVGFYWSKKERETAKRLGDKYWIYLFSDCHLNRPYHKTPLMFQDPIESILNNPQFEAEKDVLYITKKIQDG